MPSGKPDTAEKIIFIKPQKSEVFEKPALSVVGFSGMTGFDIETVRLTREAELG